MTAIVGAADAGGITGTQLLLLGAALAGVFLLTWTSRRRAVGPPARSFRRESSAAAREQEQLSRDLGELLLEVEGLARRVSAEMDTRFAKLEQAIADADRRIEELRRLTGATEAPPAPGAGRNPSAAGETDPARREIYALADEGLPLPEIARRTGRPTGEVELILNLRQHAGQARSTL